MTGRFTVQGSKGTPGKRMRRSAAIAVVAALALLVAACSAGGQPAQSAQSAAKAKAAAAAADLKITPVNGAGDADPSAGITVTAVHGTLKNVAVHTASGSVTGSLSQGGKVWHSQWALGTGTSYQVTATASEGHSGTVTRASSFRTLTPNSQFQAEIFEGYDQTYGVGMPIMLTFSQPITNRAAVERSLQLTTSKPVVGAWYWDGNEHLDFRPENYWPADTQVTFTGHLDGVEGASGVYATANLTQSFTIGASLIAVASTTSHRTQIYYNGKLRYDWPISTGKASDGHPKRHLRDDREGEPGPHDRRHSGQRGLLQRARPLVGAVHLQRRLLPRRPVVGGLPGLRQRQPRLRQPLARRRPDLLQHGRAGRPDHHHQQHEGR